jgi:membrane protease YdiL (CAAX protease family)
MPAPRRPNLVAFFLLSYALTWTCFISVAASGIRSDSLLGGSVILLGAFAPALAALSVTALAEGRAGVTRFLTRCFHTNVAARWYIFAVAFMPAVKLTAALIHRVIFGSWPQFGHDPWYLLPFAVAFSMPFQAGEEVGWRGFALPRLAERFGLAGASLVLGVIWAFWHLPQFYIQGADTLGQSFLVWAPQVAAISVAMAWLYGRANASLLPLMLMHAAINNTKDIVPSVLPGAHHVFSFDASRIAWLTAALLWILAAFFLGRMRQIGRMGPMSAPPSQLINDGPAKEQTHAHKQ